MATSTEAPQNKGESQVKRIYAIVDIETSGGSHGNRITEIAIVVTDGDQIIEKFESLINPLIHIPRSITMLTGISNEMVENAPTFSEIAPTIDKILKDKIFVAHNVSFDYGIIKSHFERAGYVFNRKTLCTVRLSRKIIPDLPSYSLGKLCFSLQITVTNRHRAMGDVLATVKLFQLLLTKDEEDFISFSLNQQSKEAKIPPNYSKEAFEQLPEKTGVYYLKDKKHQVLYVGKAINIKKRVATHFGEKSQKKSELLRRLYFVDFELLGNELIALLFESIEIQKLFPAYNKALKFKKENFYVNYYLGQDDIYHVAIFNQRQYGSSLAAFGSVVQARDFLYGLVADGNFCPKYVGLEKVDGTCSKGNLCALCSEEETKTEYNLRLEQWQAKHQLATYFIVGPGRDVEELGLVYVKNGEFYGYGYVSSDVPQAHWIDIIKFHKPNSQNRQIVQGFVRGDLPHGYTLVY